MYKGVKKGLLLGLTCLLIGGYGLTTTVRAESTTTSSQVSVTILPPSNISNSKEGVFDATLSLVFGGLLWGGYDGQVIFSVAVAHAILESQEGTSTLLETNNNLYGLKGTYKGVDGESSEEFINQHNLPVLDVTQADDRYRVYEDQYTGVLDFMAYVTSNERGENQLTSNKGVVEQAEAVERMFNKPKGYSGKLLQVIDEYELLQYDEMITNR